MDKIDNFCPGMAKNVVCQNPKNFNWPTHTLAGPIDYVTPVPPYVVLGSDLKTFEPLVLGAWTLKFND